MSRYHVSSSEGQYEKDSDEQVWLIRLGIAPRGERSLKAFRDTFMKVATHLSNEYQRFRCMLSQTGVSEQNIISTK